MDEHAGPAVRARGLYHIYREGEVETVALRGAELTLPQGSWTSVMGPSGSGKSTLLHVLAGLIEPSAGTVTVADRDITRLADRERARWRRRHIGIVLQRDNLHPLLGVAANVALPLRLDGRSGGAIRTRVRHLLGAVGLEDRARQRSGRLSGGEAQRVAIAVALAARPAVLFADEPTGELDEENTVRVLDLLDRARSDDGAAVLTVTHNAQVEARADRRMRMRDGVLVDAA
jgi:ABC-type lipoprotein export system ATPase subunit